MHPYAAAVTAALVNEQLARVVLLPVTVQSVAVSVYDTSPQLCPASSGAEYRSVTSHVLPLLPAAAVSSTVDPVQLETAAAPTGQAAKVLVGSVVPVPP